MPEIKKIPLAEAEKTFASKPVRQVGKWKQLCAEVKKTGQPVSVTDLTRGQAWNVKRTAREAGLRATVIGETEVLILPATSKASK